MQMALNLSGLANTPADSGVFVPVDKVSRILVGIDVHPADLYRSQAEGFDLIIAHHPLDKTGFVRVMNRHEELMLTAGVSPERAKEACLQCRAPYEKWAAELPSDESPEQLIELAEELHVGLMNIHTPCDEIGRIFLQKTADDLPEPRTVSRLVEAYRAIPEIAESSEDVELVSGQTDQNPGKVAVIHAAGTNGGYPVANALFDSGIGPVVYIHLDSRKQKSRLQRENKGNLIVTGHYGSDSLGINPLLDALENDGIEVSCLEEVIRIKRKQVP